MYTEKAQIFPMSKMIVARWHSFAGKYWGKSAVIYYKELTFIRCRLVGKIAAGKCKALLV